MWQAPRSASPELTPCSAEFLSIYRPFCPLSVHSVHWTYQRPLRSGGSIRTDMASTKRTEALPIRCCAEPRQGRQAQLLLIYIMNFLLVSCALLSRASTAWV